MRAALKAVIPSRAVSNMHSPHRRAADDETDGLADLWRWRDRPGR